MDLTPPFLGHLLESPQGRLPIGRGVLGARGNASGADESRSVERASFFEGSAVRPLRRLPTESLRKRISRAHPFASEQFHVLLNSLFKVLCNFPSRYLFAIGLAAVFSLRWSLPPTWSCTPKQPDSWEVAFRGDGATTGLAPALDKSPGQGDLPPPSVSGTLPPERHIVRTPKGTDFGAGLFPVRSPLLGESPLVSLPPLIYMLKFSGSSRLI